MALDQIVHAGSHGSIPAYIIQWIHYKQESRKNDGINVYVNLKCSKLVFIYFFPWDDGQYSPLLKGGH